MQLALNEKAIALPCAGHHERELARVLAVGRDARVRAEGDLHSGLVGPGEGLVDLRADGGRILYDGLDVAALKERELQKHNVRRRISMLFQGAALFDSLTVWQNVAFRLLRGSLKRPKAEAREIAIEKLRRVGLKAETVKDSLGNDVTPDVILDPDGRDEIPGLGLVAEYDTRKNNAT